MDCRRTMMLSFLILGWRTRNGAMCKTRDVAASLVIWLTALTVPVQALPALSCGCTTSNKSCCANGEQATSSCCSATNAGKRTCCCTRKRATISCCRKAKLGAKNTVCKCGSACRCRQGSEHQQAMPPVENENATQELVSLSLSTVSPATLYRPVVSRQHDDAFPHFVCVSALDRCAVLCRFAL